MTPARRSLLASLAGGLAWAPSRPFAQSAGTHHLIGYLTPQSRESDQWLREAFDTTLRELGYVEGTNLTVERRFTGGDQSLLPGLAAELVRLRPALIVATGNLGVAAVREATSTIPIVMAGAQDPVGAGFVASLARPGGNVTGVTVNPGLAILGKRLELLKEAVPGIRQLAVLRMVGETSDALFVEFDRAAVALGVRYTTFDVRGEPDLERALASIAERRPDGVFLIGGPTLLVNMKRICDFLVRHRLPGSYGIKEFARAGLLITYGLDNAEVRRKCARYVDRILRGAKPADLPVEQPRELEMAINLRTAKAIGVRIPQSVLLRADEVIE